MSKKDGSRFDGLFGSVRKPDPEEPEHPDIQTSEHPDIQTSEPKAKSKDPNYVRTTVYLPKSLHRQLKNFATDQDSEMSEVMINALEAYIASVRKPDPDPEPKHPDI